MGFDGIERHGCGEVFGVKIDGSEIRHPFDVGKGLVVGFSVADIVLERERERVYGGEE